MVSQLARTNRTIDAGVTTRTMKKKSMRAALLVAALTSGAAASSQAAGAIHIGNFGKVNDRYYRGSQPRRGDYRDLAALGVRTVLDLQKNGSSAEPALVEQAGMQYVKIPLGGEPPTEAQIADFFRIVDDPANQPVYVHCAGGRDRTGTMTALYRITHDGWSIDQAYAEMMRYHFGGLFGSPALKNFVLHYTPRSSDTVAHAAQDTTDPATH